MKCLKPLLSAAILLVVAGSLQAATLEIQFTGLNLTYNGASGFLTDSTLANDVGFGNPSHADPLTSMTFLVDGALVGPVRTTDIFSDIFIKELFHIPSAGGIVTSGGNGNSFGVDLLTSSSTPGWGLALQIDKVTVAYTGSGIGMWAVGQATTIFNQNLPGGLTLDTSSPVSYNFSSVQLTDLQVNSAGELIGFNVSGTGSIRGVLVPEPGSLSLLGLAMALFALRRVRR